MSNQLATTLCQCRWILKIKEKRKLTQQTLSEILGDVSEFCANRIAKLSESVFTKLQSAGVTPNDIPGFIDLFDSSSPFCRPFDGLDTYFHQMSFYRDHFKLIVSMICFKAWYVSSVCMVVQ